MNEALIRLIRML